MGAPARIEPILMVMGLLINTGCLDSGIVGEDYHGIKKKDLEAHVEFLASDRLEGRGTGSAGHLKAAEYGASLFREYGLEPLPGIESLENPYFQTVPLWRIQGHEASEMTIRIGEDSYVLQTDEEDFVLNPHTNVRPGVVAGKPVYVGNGIHEPELGWDDFRGLDLRDRIVVMRIGAPRDEEGENILPDERSRFYENMDGPGPETILQNIVSRGASALIVIPNEFLLENWGLLRSNYVRAVRDEEGYRALEDEPEIPVIVVNRKASSLLVSGLTDDPFQSRSIAFRGELKAVDVSLRNEVHWTSFSSPNVVGLVRGTDPGLIDQYVVAGAHLDHLGIIDGRIYNGAVDNASGAAVILEAAESVAEEPLPRPVVFVLYTAEEVGHYGSLFFVNHGPIPVDDIMVNVNVDHAGRDNPMFDDILVAGLDRIDPRVDGIVRRANERAGARLYFFAGMSERDYSGSDHYSFDLAGIPSVVYGTGRFDGYHTPEDDEEYVDYDIAFDVAKITLETIRELGRIARPLRHRQH